MKFYQNSSSTTVSNAMYNLYLAKRMDFGLTVMNKREKTNARTRLVKPKGGEGKKKKS